MNVGALKVLIVIDNLGGDGGAERLLVSVIPELKALNISCEVAALFPPYDLAHELESLGIKIHRLNLIHRWFLPESLYKLNRICRQTRFDIIWGSLFFGNLHAGFASLLRRDLKSVFYVQTIGPKSLPPATTWQRIRMRIEQFAGRYLADQIVAVSRANASEYEQALGWSRLRVAHPAIPMERNSDGFDDSERIKWRRFHAADESEFQIVVPARFVWQKGHAVIIDALSLLAKEKGWRPRCLALGLGPLKASLQEMVREAGLQETFLFSEPVSNSDLHKLMRSSDVVVLPSMHETFGMAAAEAMALGVPTIVSKIDGLWELVGESGGALMFEPGNSRGLAEALLRLRTEPALPGALGEAGKKRISETFSPKSIAKNWADIFIDVEENYKRGA